MIGAAARTADLLVIGHGRAGCANVNDEAQVRLVESHAQRGSRHERLELIVDERLFETLAFLGLRAAGVGGDLKAGTAQRLREVLRRGDGKAVDNARARQLIEVRREPGRALRRILEAQHRRVERLTVEPAAQHAGVLPQLCLDVRNDTVIRRRRRGQHWRIWAQASEQILDAPVVRAEVVTPIGDTVRLVNDEHAGGTAKLGQHRRAEGRIIEALGRDEHEVCLTHSNRGVEIVPLRHIRAVNGHRADARAGGGLHLVAHERQQRRNDDRGPKATGTQQLGCDEIHG